jgi:hypothetical protein
MATKIRNILAFIGGAAVGSAINMSLVLAGSFLVPPPAGVNVNDAESIRAAAHLFEAKHYIFPFLAHAAGTLAGALAAHLIAGSHRRVFAFAVGVLFLAGGIAASFMIPAPVWFILLDLVAAYIPMAWVAALLGHEIRGRSPQ